MTRFLLKLRSLWFFYTRWPEWPVKVPAWTADDKLALQGFLRTPSGIKLRMALEQMEQYINRESARRPDATQFFRGFATGYQSSFSWLLSLGQPSRQDLPARPLPDNGDTNSEESKSAEALFAERYSA